jgi:hypothetical protein
MKDTQREVAFVVAGITISALIILCFLLTYGW